MAESALVAEGEIADHTGQADSSRPASGAEVGAGPTATAAIQVETVFAKLTGGVKSRAVGAGLGAGRAGPVREVEALQAAQALRG